MNYDSPPKKSYVCAFTYKYVSEQQKEEKYVLDN